MDSSISKTDAKDCEFGYRNKFVCKWIPNSFDCPKSAKSLGITPPSVKLYFTLNNINFEGKLSLYLNDCKQICLRLDIESTIGALEYRVHVLFKAPNKIEDGYLTERKKSEIFHLYESNYRRYTHISYQTIICDFTLDPQLPILFPPATINHGLGQLFKRKQFCDVTFVVDGRELHAHKCILSSRSDVFAAMFENEMVEANSNKVVITDISFEVFEQVLNYIYTDEVINLGDIAKEALAVSDKYNLQYLKRFCEFEFQKKISIPNAVETLMVADLYVLQDLKRNTIDFINKNATAVANTEDWQEIVKNKIYLLIELYMADKTV